MGSLRSQRPGRYRLEVLPRGGQKPVVTVPDIQVSGGELNKDPRLDEIDLRGKLRRITIAVRDAAGGPLPETNYGPAAVLINDPTPDAELQGFAAQNGSASILTAEPYVNLLVVARGYRPKEITGVSSDTTVTLEPFPEILVTGCGEVEGTVGRIRGRRGQSPDGGRRSAGARGGR